MGKKIQQEKQQEVQAIAILCSFCCKTSIDVKKLIAAPAAFRIRAYICDECIAVCNSILMEEKTDSISPTLAASLRRELQILESVQRIEVLIRERMPFEAAEWLKSNFQHNSDVLGAAQQMLDAMKRGEWPGGNEPFPNEAERELIESSPTTQAKEGGKP